MEQLKKTGIVLLVAFIGFVAGKFHGPAEIKTLEVERVVYRRSSEVQKDVNKREEVRPDGTKITETTSTTKRRSDTKLDEETSKLVIQKARPDWRVNVLYQPTIVSYQGERYTLDVQRRMFSEVYLGINVSNDNTLGVSLSLGF
jgi:hypothetical protein